MPSWPSALVTTRRSGPGRLTVNPIAHIDPVGLFMVVAIGIGYAKPVPTDPRNFTSRFADLWVAAAGPFMNLVVAAVVLNVFVLLVKLGFGAVGTDGVQVFVAYLVGINLVLMVFNLIPLGPLDGHYILPYFLPRQLARKYVQFNARYGALALLGPDPAAVRRPAGVPDRHGRGAIHRAVHPAGLTPAFAAPVTLPVASSSSCTASHDSSARSRLRRVRPRSRASSSMRDGSRR